MEKTKKNKKLVLLSFILIIYAISFRGIHSFYISEIIFLGLFGMKLLELAKKGNFIIDKKLMFVVYWLYLYILYLLLNIWQAANVSEYFTNIIYFLIGIVIFMVLIFYIRSKKQLITFIKMFTGINVFIALTTLTMHILFLVTGFKTELVHVGATVRSVGFYGNPNYYSISLLLALGMLMGLYSFKLLSNKFMNEINIFLISYLILMTGIFLTFSRGALVAGLVVSIIFFAYNMRILMKKNIYIISAIILMGAVLIIDFRSSHIFLQMYDQLLLRLENAIYGTGAGRYTIWEEGWLLISSNWNFFIFGVGGNQFPFYNPHNVHNGYLRFLYEAGVIGVLFFLILLLKLFLNSFNFKTVKPLSPLFYPLLAFLIMALSNDVFIIKEFWFLVSLVFLWRKLEIDELKN
ncbi:O-antigen ligase family protein [Planococcus rifietoensis]|uniref:O-antigen ligase family protein n=1 Tax=Planococcus rifietoensis TaxID=200991 RepID=UPI00384C8B3D